MLLFQMLDRLGFQTISVRRVDPFSYVTHKIIPKNLHTWVKTLYIRLWLLFTRYRIAFAYARKSYQIGLLLTHKDGDFGAIFDGAKLRRAPLISKVESHTSDRCSYSTTG